MCTLIMLRRADAKWPIMVAANRDEMIGRKWRPPARHWPDRAETVAGMDEEAGGSWLGLNDYGVMAAILNRPGGLGPAPGKRSRGELVMEALDHADAIAAAEALADLNGQAYRGFNLVIADNRDAYWLRNAERKDGLVECLPIPEGLSMFTAHDRNDRASPRIEAYYDRFETAAAPAPESGDWSSWNTLLSDTGAPQPDGSPGGLTIRTDWGYGTVSASLIALPAMADADTSPVWLFAPGPPDETDYQAVDFSVR